MPTNQIEEREIEGKSFKIGRLPLAKQREGLVKITKVVGPAAGALASGDTGEGMKVLVEALKYEELEWFVKAFCEVSTVKLETGVDLKVSDGVFEGDLKMQLEWLWACLEVNYGAFLGAKGTAAADFLKAKVLSR